MANAATVAAMNQITTASAMIECMAHLLQALLIPYESVGNTAATAADR
jgi:hypothetical protein